MSDFPLPGPVAVPRRWWPNPIFRRYVRSRLRPQALMVALLITVILAGFLYFSFRTGFRYRGQMEVADAERATVYLGKDESVELDLDAVAWARPYVNENSRGAAPKRVDAVLSPGDPCRLPRM